MPKMAGRSGMPGNDTKYRPIEIMTANPKKLQAKAVAGRKATSTGIKWEKGKFSLGK